MAKTRLEHVQRIEPFSGRGLVEQYRATSGTSLIFHRPKGLVGANCYIWFPVGSRDESSGSEGLAHLVEHLIFQKNSPRVKNCIDTIEALGGELNACTTKEYVCYELNALSTDINKMLPSFFEMVFMPDQKSWDVKKELKVIAEELREDLSDPEVVVGEKVFEKAFSFPLGHSVGGKISHLKKLTLPKAKSFYNKYFSVSDAVICLISDCPFSDYQNKVEESFDLVPKLKVKERKIKNRQFGKIESFKLSVKKEVDGCFLSYIWPGPPITGKFRLELALLDHMLCGGLGSYFFEELRTKRGLIYSASSQLHSFSDNGLYEIEIFCQKPRLEKVKTLFSELWKKLVEEDILGSEDLEKAKNQVIGSWSLELDDIEVRNSYLSRGLIFRQKIKDFDELCKDLREIKLYDIKQLLKWLGPVPVSTTEILPKAKRS